MRLKRDFEYFEITFIDLYEHAQIPSQSFLLSDSLPTSPTHLDIYLNQVSIIHKKNYKKTPFTPNVE